MDYTLEITENKVLKGTGGIIGLTNRGSALVRWSLTRPVTAQYSAMYQRNINSENEAKEQSAYHGAGKAACERSDDHVQKMVKMFEGSFIDPFDITEPPTYIINFSNGAAASPEV
jgi:hypothetical protein